LAALGLSRLVTRPATIGFGKSYPEFWINLRAGMAKVAPESGTHICCARNQPPMSMPSMPPRSCGRRVQTVRRV